ncbi:hypothetical protein [Legionella maioricensis]|uniref:Transmembrane protein n=1 Tax=Legionella maioricensis TaxID=2896528 RepID=A0A9X2ICK2_9GAMM|nr:hypothetical protein [Legionella maioricensis]MCL9685311.1 hypothetical protein [Legionella maioricensis]MCL9688566.1 hypothetical protein [Legionella maioricensis]
MFPEIRNKSFSTYVGIFLVWSILIDLLFFYFKKNDNVNKQPARPTNVILVPVDNQPAPCQEAFTKAGQTKDSNNVYHSLEKVCTAAGGGAVKFRIITSENIGEPIGVSFTCPIKNSDSPIFSCVFSNKVEH